MGDLYIVTVDNLEPDTTINVALGDASADGVADADGTASVDIDVL